MRKALVLSAAAAAFGLFGIHSSEAAPAFTWPVSPAYSQSVTDPDDITSFQTTPAAKTLTAGQDILSADYAFDAGYHYFRLNLDAAPSGTAPAPGNTFAGVYGIYIDYQVGGVDDTVTVYVANSLKGIDIILDGHWNYGGGGPNFPVSGQHNHIANLTNDGFNYATLDGFNPQVGGSSSIEFKLDAAYLPSNFTWWGGTMDHGSESFTYDLTRASAVPAPSTLGSGLVLLSMWMGSRRRRR